MDREMFRIFSNLFALEISLAGWSTGRGGWGGPADLGDPPSVAGLLEDQGVLKEGLGGWEAFWGLRVVAINEPVWKQHPVTPSSFNPLCGKGGGSGNQASPQ